MSLKYRNVSDFEKYDMISNHVIFLFALFRRFNKVQSMSHRDFDIRKVYKLMDFRVIRADSSPTGTMAAESMTIEFMSYNSVLFDKSKYFQIKFNQKTNTIGFKLNKEYDRNFEYCLAVKQSDNMQVILSHITKILFDYSFKNMIFSQLGYEVEFHEFSQKHYNLLEMTNI